MNWELVKRVVVVGKFRKEWPTEVKGLKAGSLDCMGNG